MPTALWGLLVATSVVALLWILTKKRATEHIQQIEERHRASSRIVGRGSFMESGGRIDVALALTDSMFYYESDAMQAFLELAWVQEVEYDSELSTGRSVSDGKVMRLRCHSRVFEFVVPDADAPRWESAFPAHRLPMEVRA